MAEIKTLYSGAMALISPFLFFHQGNHMVCGERIFHGLWGQRGQNYCFWGHEGWRGCWGCRRMIEFYILNQEPQHSDRISNRYKHLITLNSSLKVNKYLIEYSFVLPWFKIAMFVFLMCWHQIERIFVFKQVEGNYLHIFNDEYFYIFCKN